LDIEPDAEVFGSRSVLDASSYRSGYAEFDKRALGGLMHSSDVELGAPRVIKLRRAASSNPHGGDLRWTRWRFVVLLCA